jgi:hypothetical protein
MGVLFAVVLLIMAGTAVLLLFAGMAFADIRDAWSNGYGDEEDGLP